MGWMAFMLTISAWAQQSLSGKVLDAKSGEPLVGASVWTEKIGRGGITDGEGNFTILNLPTGE